VRGAAPVGGGRQRCDPGRIWCAAGGAERGQRQPAGALCHPPAPGLAAQKKTLRASEQERADVAAERVAFAERIKSIAPENLVFLDETGVSTKLTRLYARASRGQRAHGSAPGHWRRLTVLGALALGGLVAVMTVAAATDWPVFQAFLQQVLIPALCRHKPGATIVMDHLAAHRIPQARALLESAGFTLLPLPRYSPDLSPIEPCWSKLKTLLRTVEPRSIAAIEEQIAPALDTITPADAKGWFRHCGYSVSN
jgi:transposase